MPRQDVSVALANCFCFQVENRRLERVLRPREDELLGDGPKEKRNESALLIDRLVGSPVFRKYFNLNLKRYRFLDLFPCTREELRSMGYKDAGSLMSELIVSVYFRFKSAEIQAPRSAISGENAKNAASSFEPDRAPPKRRLECARGRHRLRQTRH